MANDAKCHAVVSLAKVHIQRAWDAFCDDPAIPWRSISGCSPPVAGGLWIGNAVTGWGYKAQEPGRSPRRARFSIAHQLYAEPRSVAALLTSRGATHRMAP
jgi:hypothetical protein